MISSQTLIQQSIEKHLIYKQALFGDLTKQSLLFEVIGKGYRVVALKILINRSKLLDCV